MLTVNEMLKGERSDMDTCRNLVEQAITFWDKHQVQADKLTQQANQTYIEVNTLNYLLRF